MPLKQITVTTSLEKRQSILPEIESQYLCNSPINVWLRLNPNCLHSTYVNIPETGFDDKLVSKRKLKSDKRLCREEKSIKIFSTCNWSNYSSLE